MACCALLSGGPYKTVEDLWDDQKMAGQAISDRYRLDLELPTATLSTGGLSFEAPGLTLGLADGQVPVTGCRFGVLQVRAR